ncbi:MAG: ComE operon protein 1 [Microgenomates bacterium OLB23]|nr:MAG: ComE operon protein 1 [Microgenomates bacterium OLB23]
MHFITYAKKLGAYRIELLLGVLIALSVGLLAIMTAELGRVEFKKSHVLAPTPLITAPVQHQLKIYAEISGAVYKPGVYMLKKDARLYELIEIAGGLNKQADKAFFLRNYNQARVLVDGEKIHAPSYEEIAQGAFIEQPLIIFSNELGVLGKTAPNSAVTTSETPLISINEGSAAELESLPGVGAVTAEKIISSRPYGTVDELHSKGIISESLYKKIYALVSL